MVQYAQKQINDFFLFKLYFHILIVFVNEITLCCFAFEQDSLATCMLSNFKRPCINASMKLRYF